MKYRIESLDVLRGFDMFFIFLPDPTPCIVLTFLGMFGLEHSAFALQFDHCAWNGLRFYDCIFPLFLFISGVTFPFSYARQRERGDSTAKIVCRVLKRTAILLLMGSMLWTTIDGVVEKNILAFEWSTFRVWSVIGRIGLAWGAAAILYMFFGRKTRIGIAAGILVAMWLVFRFAVAPGAPDGVNPMIDHQWMWANWIDVHYLTTAHRGEGGVSTITMVATAMFGNFAGEILSSAKSTPGRKAGNLLGFAAVLVVSGLLMAFAFGMHSLPVNKPIWSSSFALVAGGISAALLSLFYWIVDVRGWRKWGFFFKVIGMNAITLYLLVRTVFNWQFESEYFFGGICRCLPPAVGATALAQNCYQQMFYGCTALEVNTSGSGKEWKLPNATTATDWGKDMFTGTSGTLQGTPDLNTTYYIASAPKETDCITFSADKAFGIKLTKTGKQDDPSLECSTDQINWSKVSSDTDYPAAKDGETYKIHFRGTGNLALAKGASTYHRFANTEGSAATAIACSGNIMTLLDYQTVAKGEEPTMGASAFNSLFWGFTALTAAPELPATTLAKACYYMMFKKCTSLTTAPELPSETLTNACYNAMFQNCTSLTVAPELPAMTAAQDCYNQMFQGCTSLTAAPALNATTLTNGCYKGMFKDCTSLTAAPKLPATTLANSCYNEMFRGCTSLTAAPALPATTLAQYCYLQMFYGCTSLVVNKAAPGKEWKIPATTGEGATNWGKEMFTGTSGDMQGTPELNTTYYIASAPKETDCITFSADAAFGMKLTKSGTLDDPSLEYSTDQINWSKVDVGTGYDAAKDGETYKIHFRGTGNQQLATSLSKYHRFANTEGSAATAIACSGNIMTLLDYQTVAKGEEPTMDKFAFTCLFSGFAALTTAPELPATMLTTSCYSSMFSGCTALTYAPALNATTLAGNCCQCMFQDCTSLTTAPELPAMTVANNCYTYMFKNCTSLTAAPALPATTLANNCYQYMFRGCTSLTAAPKLPATTLARDCYNGMFQDCTSLTEAPALPATTLQKQCYCYMFKGCTSLVVNTAAPGKEWKIPATTGATDWGADMFAGTGGDVTGAPELNTTYYVRSAVAVVEPAAVTGASTVKVYTNGTVEVAGPPYAVEPNAAVTVKYTADAGYEFAGGKTTWATNFTASAATVAVTIPEGEQPQEKKPCTDCITFTSAASFTLKTANSSKYWNGTLWTSTDQLNWTEWNGAEVTAAQAGGAGAYNLYVRGNTNNTVITGTNKRFVLTASADSTIACTGNIETLRGATGDDPSPTPMAEKCYYYLFYVNKALTSAPALNATTLAQSCYQDMFSGCAALTSAPALPATALKQDCYRRMFYGCTSLTAAPALSATTLATNCCYQMFNLCTSLTTAPALNATTLAGFCYAYMFQGCTALTSAPALPATTLAENCYKAMFSGCTALTTAPELPATTLAENCYRSMFYGCASLVVNKDAPGKEWKIPATTGEGATDWGKEMFTGTGGTLQGTPDLNTTYYVGAKKEVVGDVTLYRYGDQVGVSVAGELTKAMADSIKDQGITNLIVGTGVTGVGAGAFEGWRSLRDVTISTNCTAIGADAFHRCQNVTNVTVKATETVAVGDYAFYRCNSLEKLSFAHLPSWGETPFSFYSAIYMKDGIPEVYAIPSVEAGTAKQKLYGTNKLEGKSTEWTEIETEEQKTQFNFFKIALEM